MLIREVDDHEAAAADSSHVRLRDAERGGSSHGGVDRVASLAQDLDSGPGGVRVDRRNRAARSNCDGLPRRRPSGGRGRSAHEEGNQRCTRDGAENPGTHTTHITETVTPKPGRPRGRRGGRLVRGQNPFDYVARWRDARRLSRRRVVRRRWSGHGRRSTGPRIASSQRFESDYDEGR